MVRQSAGRFAKFGIPANRRPAGDMELALRSWVRYLRGWRMELAAGGRWGDRLRAWPRGFTTASWRLFGLDQHDPDLFAADFPLVLRGTRINGFWNPIVGNKLVLSYIARATGVPCPPILGCIVRGRPHDFAGRRSSELLDTLADWSEGEQGLVFRPHWSGGGEGVFFVDRRGGRWSINGHPAEPDDLRQVVGNLDRYLVTRRLEQARYAREIFPRTANTLRVLTLRDDAGPFVAAAVHRFGSSHSFPVDNFHQGRGGLCAAMDRESGVMGKAATTDPTGRPVLHTHHPETGAPIEGVQVTHYHEAIAGLLRLCEALPEARSVGWDVLITEDGYSVLEGNSPPSMSVWQVHQPLRADPRIARFLAAHGVGSVSDRP